MTCIVGVAEGGHVWVGGDSAGVGGTALTVRADAKVFRNGQYVMGFTSSFRMGQLLRYSLKPPEAPTNGKLDAFMVNDFTNAVRACLKAGGYAKKDGEKESGGTFLVGVHGRIFTIYDDYQVGESVSGFDAVGCGDDVAKGALSVTPDIGPAKRVRMALRAAEQWSSGVRGPFKVVRL